tara:strand:- start:1853 stop:6388 length:4536 start_codon:yes stop_codon:yes gene_type:complete
MKKGVILTVILLFSISFVSAGWFGDFWKTITENNKITGRVIGDSCIDSDGKDYYVKGTGTLLESHEDYCNVGGTLLYEYICNEDIGRRDSFYVVVNGIEVEIEYKGADKVYDSSPKVKFEVPEGNDMEYSLNPDGTFILKLMGETLNFVNASSAENDNFDIKLLDREYLVREYKHPCEEGCVNGACGGGCIENWDCELWGECDLITRVQTRACTDLNNCGTENNKPSETQDCCPESWTCTDWSECIDEHQTKTCTDSNNCGTTVFKPAVSRSCSVCTESDDGKDYYVNGTTRGKGIIGDEILEESDYCTKGGTDHLEAGPNIQERFCNDQGFFHSTFFHCPNGCIDGACIAEGETASGICEDSDGGDNILQKGTSVYNSSFFNEEYTDYCEGNKLIEHNCQPIIGVEIIHANCVNGCVDGACIGGEERYCNDSDGGKNIYEAGTMEVFTPPNSISHAYDGCFFPDSETQEVIEWYCEGVNLKSEKIPCPEGSNCSEGRCILSEVDGCTDGTSYNECSTNKPSYCDNGTLVDNCSNCGCSMGEECNETNNICYLSEIQTENKKNMNLYSTKETFLISDKNWKDVLPFVSVAVWTQQEGDNSECQRGYGTPDDVCVYPFLIYHEEERIEENTPIELHTFSWEINEIVETANEIDNNSLFEFALTALNTRIELNVETNTGLVDIDLMYGEGDNFIELGKSSYSKLITSNDGKIFVEDGNFFIVSYEYSQIQFSQYFGLRDIDSSYVDEDTYEVEFRDRISDFDRTFELKLGDTFRIAQPGLDLKVEGISSEHIELSIVGGGSFNEIYDADGNYMVLPSSDEFPTEDYTFKIWSEENPPGEATITSSDIDSSIYFMQQYSPDKLTIIGQTTQELDNLLITGPELGAGLQENQIQRISEQDYLYYWQEYRDVVYVEDNYELALLASTYASLINAPLIIKNNLLDTEETFSSRNIICVGNVNINCNENYNLEQLQQKYVDETNTNKIILVNPGDLNINLDEQFQPDKSANPIYEIYSKTSLVAPILAGAKKELLIGINQINSDSVKIGYETRQAELGFIPLYTTIFAAPNAIEMSRFDSDYDKYLETDSKFRNINGFKTYVGRIFSLTSSDNSAYVARDLFYKKNPQSSLVIAKDFPYASISKWGLSQLFNKVGLEIVSFIDYPTAVPQDLEKKDIIVFSDHGDNAGWSGVVGSGNLPYLDDSIIFSEACSICAFEKNQDYAAGSLFCSNVIRKGAIAFFGATTDNAYGTQHMISINKFLSGDDAGKSSNTKEINHRSPMVFVGDPTFKLQSNLLPKSSISRNEDNFNIALELIGFYNNSESNVLFGTNGDELTQWGEDSYYGSSTFVTLGPFDINTKYNINEISDKIHLSSFESYSMADGKYFDINYQINRHNDSFEPDYSEEFYDYEFNIGFTTDLPNLVIDNVETEMIYLYPTSINLTITNYGDGTCIRPVLEYLVERSDGNIYEKSIEFYDSLNPERSLDMPAHETLIFSLNFYFSFGEILSNFTIKCESVEE